RPNMDGPIFGLGRPGTAVSALATALSMLGFRCCSDVSTLPEGEWRSVFEGTDPRRFDAYVNVGSVDEEHLEHLARLHPSAKFVVAIAGDRIQTCGSDQQRSVARTDGLPRSGHDSSSGRGIHSSRPPPLQSGHHDRWRLLTEFLGCEYPSHQYPPGPDPVQ